MGNVSFTKDVIAIDLGTTNTRIILNDRVILDEPSIVGIENVSHSGKCETLIAVGKKALQLQGNEEKIKIIRPIKGGVIHDFHSALMMIKEMIRMAGLKSSFFMPGYKMLIGVPFDMSEAEERSIMDLAKQSGAKKVKLIYKPIAAAIGMGVDIFSPYGNMIIDIGGGTSEIALIANGGIISGKTLRTGGNDFNKDIERYIKKLRNMKIKENETERIKIEIGSTIVNVSKPNHEVTLKVNGEDMFTKLPVEVLINYRAIASALDQSIIKIEEAIMYTLETTPREFKTGILKNGVYLTGGSSLLKGFDKRIELKTGFKVQMAENPFHTVAKGNGIELKKFN